MQKRTPSAAIRVLALKEQMQRYMLLAQGLDCLFSTRHTPASLHDVQLIHCVQYLFEGYYLESSRGMTVHKHFSHIQSSKLCYDGLSGVARLGFSGVSVRPQARLPNRLDDKRCYCDAESSPLDHHPAWSSLISAY
jgi:hypothetical protein